MRTQKNIYQKRKEKIKIVNVAMDLFIKKLKEMMMKQIIINKLYLDQNIKINEY